MSKAGSMAASMAWLIAIGGGVVGTLLGFYVPGIIGFILGTAVLVGSGWAAVHMTQASAGKGCVLAVATKPWSGLITCGICSNGTCSACQPASGFQPGNGNAPQPIRRRGAVPIIWLAMFPLTSA